MKIHLACHRGAEPVDVTMRCCCHRMMSSTVSVTLVAVSSHALIVTCQLQLLTVPLLAGFGMEHRNMAGPVLAGHGTAVPDHAGLGAAVAGFDMAHSDTAGSEVAATAMI